MIFQQHYSYRVKKTLHRPWRRVTEKESSQKTVHLLSGLQVWRSRGSYQTHEKGEEKQGCSVGEEFDEGEVQEVEEKMYRPVELVTVVSTCGALQLAARVKQF
jgi:hypothetical protein